MGKTAEKIMWAREEYLGLLLELDTEKSIGEYVEFVRAQSEKGDSPYMMKLGRMYRDGLGVDKDFGAAKLWMWRASASNQMFGQEYYDFLLSTGDPDDRKEAFAVCSDLAKSGDSKSMMDLGRMYRDGKAVDKDLDAAKLWMRRGYASNPALIHEYCDLLMSTGDPEDLKKAFEAYSEHAKTGNARSMVRLGRMYRDGKGVKKDLKAAKLWMGRGAESHPSMSHEYCDLLMSTGDPEDQKEAFAIYSEQARSGNSRSMVRLGRMYRDGLGVEKDLDKAKLWMGKAATSNPSLTHEYCSLLMSTGDPEDQKKAAAIRRERARSKNAR